MLTLLVHVSLLSFATLTRVARVVSKEESRLVLTADGRWKQDGDAATHRGVVSFFHRQIRKDIDGAYYLHNALEVPGKGTLEEHVYFEIEDTPYFVRHVRWGEAAGRFEVELSAGERELLRLDTLVTDEAGQLYCRVKDGDEARFDRHAMTELEPFLDSDDRGMYLRAGQERVRLGTRIP